MKKNLKSITYLFKFDAYDGGDSRQTVLPSIIQQRRDLDQRENFQKQVILISEERRKRTLEKERERERENANTRSDRRKVPARDKGKINCG